MRGGYEEMCGFDLSRRTEKDGWPRISLWGMGIATDPTVQRDGLPESIAQLDRATRLLSSYTARGTQRPLQTGHLCSTTRMSAKRRTARDGLALRRLAISNNEWQGFEYFS